MRRVKKVFVFLIYIFIAALVISVGYATYVYFTNKPPLTEINEARESLALAKTKMAGKYAGERLGEAESLYKWSMKEWQNQNAKFFVFRDYSLTRELALKSLSKSQSAGSEAKTAKDKIQKTVESNLTTLKKQIAKFEKYYKHLALGASTHRNFSKGKTRYLEAQIEYGKKNYQTAAKLCQKASESVTLAEKAANIKLTEFYSNYPKWEKDAKLAYNLSKKGQTVILVDKISASCIILKNGKEYKSFNAEFGISWMGNKLYAGDKATPEGVYRITEKKSRAKTNYYKALLINYPNQEDTNRFNKMVRSGEISKRAGIGGLIEIHGDGGKGIHWTDGCIALTNNEMDEVFSQCSVNTPVIIVGSRKPLEDYLN